MASALVCARTLLDDKRVFQGLVSFYILNITPTVAGPHHHHAYRRAAGRPPEVVEAAPAPRTTAA